MTWIPILRAGALALGALAAACSPLEAVNLLVPEAGYEREAGLSYGPAARHRLDVYRPRAPEPSGTVVVFFYGGSWRKGSRADYAFAGAAFASRGYVTVVPDYRLYPEVRFPAFLEDGARAIAWVRREIAAHGGDPDRIVLAGHSAGAHTAALLALDRRYLKAAGVPSSAIVGAIGLAGPYNFDPAAYRSTRDIFATAASTAETRPVSFAQAGAPPMLLLHGLDDTTVQPKNSTDLAEALESAGASARYVPLETIGHIAVLLALASPFEGLAPVMPEAEAFLRDLEPKS